MAVLSIEEFKEQSSVGAHSSEKIYQGKTIVAGPVFSLTNFKAAALYCKRFTRKTGGALCIIVRERSFLRIWSENIHHKQQNLKKKTKVASQSSSAKDNTKASANLLPVEPEFVVFCQKILAEYIGPVAPILCKKTLAKKTNLTHEQFVEILAKKISDPQEATEFRQAVLETFDF